MSDFRFRSALGFSTPYPRGSLICYACQSRFSNLMERCPNCGYLLRLEPKRAATRFALGGTFFALVVLLVIGASIYFSEGLRSSEEVVRLCAVAVVFCLARAIHLALRLRKLEKS